MTKNTPNIAITVVSSAVVILREYKDSRYDYVYVAEAEAAPDRCNVFDVVFVLTLSHSPLGDGEVPCHDPMGCDGGITCAFTGKHEVSRSNLDIENTGHWNMECKGIPEAMI